MKKNQTKSNQKVKALHRQGSHLTFISFFLLHKESIHQ